MIYSDEPSNGSGSKVTTDRRFFLKATKLLNDILLSRQQQTGVVHQ